MAASHHNPQRTNWQRRIIFILWALYGIVIVTQLIILDVAIHLVPDFSRIGYIQNNMGKPDLLFLLLMLAMEFYYRKVDAESEWSLIIGSNLIALTMVSFISADLRVGPVLFMIPLLVSILYLQRKYLFFSTSISLLYLVGKILAEPVLDGWDLSVSIILGSFYIAVCFTGLGVIYRGQELVTNLEATLESEQELRIKTIVMDRLSKIDPLTELYNHKTYHEYIEKLVEHQSVHPFELQLAVVDIDNFKKVNDTYGHAIGDLALKQVSACIKAHLDSDDFAARYGGEEFVLILTGKPPEKNAAVLEAIRHSIEYSTLEEMDGRGVTVSMGVHIFRMGDTKESIFHQADAGLYEAKRTGKNKIILV